MAYRLSTDMWSKDSRETTPRVSEVEGEAGACVEVPRDTGLQGWSSSPVKLASYLPGPDENAATFRYIRSTFYKWAMPRKSPSNIFESPSQAI